MKDKIIKFMLRGLEARRKNAKLPTGYGVGILCIA